LNHRFLFCHPFPVHLINRVSNPYAGKRVRYIRKQAAPRLREQSGNRECFFISFITDNQLNNSPMKIPKSLIQTITVAVTVAMVATVTSSCKKEAVNPEEKKVEEQKLPDSCPACGMG
jgi:hypothetical protein